MHEITIRSSPPLLSRSATFRSTGPDGLVSLAYVGSVRSRYAPNPFHILVRQTGDDSVVLHNQQIQHSIVINVHHIDALALPRVLLGRVRSVNCPCRSLLKTWSVSEPIDDRSIGIAICIEIGPGKVLKSVETPANG